jgi:hypothetical protein
VNINPLKVTKEKEKKTRKRIVFREAKFVTGQTEIGCFDSSQTLTRFSSDKDSLEANYWE